MKIIWKGIKLSLLDEMNMLLFDHVVIFVIALSFLSENFFMHAVHTLLLGSKWISSVILKMKCFLDIDGSPGKLSEELVMQEKQKKSWRMNCDVGEETEGLENELWCR